MAAHEASAKGFLFSFPGEEEIRLAFFYLFIFLNSGIWPKLDLLVTIVFTSAAIA